MTEDEVASMSTDTTGDGCQLSASGRQQQQRVTSSCSQQLQQQQHHEAAIDMLLYPDWQAMVLACLLVVCAKGSMLAVLVGSNLTTNLRDFFGIGRSKTSKAVKRQEEQDLKGFNSGGEQPDVHR